MQKELQDVCDSLDDLSDAIIKGSDRNSTISSSHGWQYPNLNRYDLAHIAYNISENLRNLNISNLDEEHLVLIKGIPRRILEFKMKTLIHFYNRNGNIAIPVYNSLINWINSILSPLYGWETLYDTKAMPKNLSKRLGSIQTQLSNLIPDKEVLEKQIQTINEATEVADSLPVDIENLKKILILI